MKGNVPSSYRAFRFKAWYLLLAANAVIAIFSVGNICSFAYIGEDVSAFDSMMNGFGGGLGVVGIMCAVLVAVFVGREFSGGAVRNNALTVSGGGSPVTILLTLAVSMFLPGGSAKMLAAGGSGYPLYILLPLALSFVCVRIGLRLRARKELN